MILRHAKRAHVGLGYIVAAVAIGCAILLGVLSLALAAVAQNPVKVQAWLEHRTHQPVAFSAVHTRWTRLGPLLQLRDLRIGRGVDAVAVGDAELLASMYRGLLPGHAFTELRIRGLDITLERAADGLWHVRGLPGQQRAGQDPFAVLDRLGELHVVGGRLRLLAPDHGLDARIPRVDVRLRVDGARVRAGVRAWPRDGSQPLDGVLDFDRRKGDGRAYAGAREADLSDWSGILRVAGMRVAGGRGSAEAWADLRGRRIVAVSVRTDLGNVAVDGAPLDGTIPRLRVDGLEIVGRLQAGRGGWAMALPRLRVRQDGRTQTLDGLSMHGGHRFGLTAGRIDGAPLLQAAALSDRLPPAARRWIRVARPTGIVSSLRVDGGRAGLRVAASVSSLGIQRVGGAPGVRGLAGRLEGDGNGLQFEFDPQSPVRVSWPQAFGSDHALRLNGRAAAWRGPSGWSVGTSFLRLRGDGYAAALRGALRWQGDGSRPFIDLAADVEPAQVPVARRLWVRHIMSPGLIRWLDAALVGGQVQDGRVVVAGDLDHWPFRGDEGRFEARARATGATLRFRPDWPAAEQVDAQLVFRGDGFGIAGTGRIGEVALPRFTAAIADYRGGILEVDMDGRGDAGAILEVLRRSPLEPIQRETFRALSASGPASLGLALRLPLARPATMEVAGTVRLQGASLMDRRWNLRFDEVHGIARYDRRGFDANDLAARHAGQGGRLSLRAGPGHVRASGNAFEGDVDGMFDIDELLARAPEMGWLGPHVEGRSAWQVGVVVPTPAPGAAAVARLQLRSSLIGTAIDLPAPLRKPAGQALEAFVDTPLPLGSGEVTVGLGELMAVRARSSAQGTGVRVHLGAGSIAEPAPARGLVATGRADRLDALDWIAFARGSGSGGRGSLPLQKLDVTTPRLGMLGGEFGETRVQVLPTGGGGLLVRTDGRALGGSVTVPAGDGAISGRFDRVYWQGGTNAGPGRAADGSRSAMPRGPAPTPVATRMPMVPSAFDPARIPALALEIDDLRFGTARLGAAQLRTRPTPAGMQLQEFATRSPGQRLQASGEWIGRGSAARTRLRAVVSSTDFGALLDGLGMGGRLGGGRGSAQLDAAWPGAPTDFDVATLEGRLSIDARDGRLLQVEPGAGRVLGLLSLTELPRRLNLDFRDFFDKGFSFNRLRGNLAVDDGLARSDDLAIRGPAADIRIRGAANLRAQTFDQTIEVLPRSGNLLTAVGALTGGPVGAAIGAAANAVLRRPLSHIGAKTYRVTGPWSAPKVQVMTRNQGRVHVAMQPAG